MNKIKERNLKEYAIENGMEYLLDEWDFEKNGELTPEKFAFDSKQTVWWKHSVPVIAGEAFELSWEGTVANRIKLKISSRV